MQSANAQELTIKEIRKILLRHPPSITQIADKLDVRASTVSIVLQEKSGSERIVEACRKLAHTLLEQEQREKGQQ